MDSKKDFIFIEGLEMRCVIGIFAWERKIRQKIRIDLKILTDARRAASRDRVEDTINYKQVVKFLLAKVRKSRFFLIESLAEFIARHLLREFGFQAITLRLSKPGAIRGALNVGVQITRKKKGKTGGTRRGGFSEKT